MIDANHISRERLMQEILRPSGLVNINEAIRSLSIRQGLGSKMADGGIVRMEGGGSTKDAINALQRYIGNSTSTYNTPSLPTPKTPEWIKQLQHAAPIPPSLQSSPWPAWLRYPTEDTTNLFSAPVVKAAPFAVDPSILFGGIGKPENYIPTEEEAQKNNAPPSSPPGGGGGKVSMGVGVSGGVGGLADFPWAQQPDLSSTMDLVQGKLPDRFANIDPRIAAMEEKVQGGEKSALADAMLTFGLGALGGSSPYAGVNVGRAGLAAQQAYKKDEGDRDKQLMDMLKLRGDLAAAQSGRDATALQGGVSAFGALSNAASHRDSALANVFGSIQQYKAALATARARSNDAHADRILNVKLGVAKLLEQADSNGERAAKAEIAADQTRWLGNDAAQEAYIVKRVLDHRRRAIESLPKDLQSPDILALHPDYGKKVDSLPKNATLRGRD